jgi:hypothetical protein
MTMLAVRRKVEHLNTNERRLVNGIIRSPDTTENTLMPWLGITVGEYCVAFLTLREKSTAQTTTADAR